MITEYEYQIEFISSIEVDYENKLENLMKRSKLPENTKEKITDTIKKKLKEFDKEKNDLLQKNPEI